MPAHTLRIALLHLAPIPGDLTRNRRLVETAVTTAARLGATWIITPELIVTGYTFVDSIGTEWILPQPDSWMTHMSQLVARLRVTLFLSCPEQDRKSRKFYNSLFVIAANGTIVGTHRKINTLRVGSEAWATPRNAGCRHTSPSVHTCRDADLCGCIYVGDRSKPTGPRGATTGLSSRMGTGSSWPEWRMGAMHPRHRAPAHRLQSGPDRTLDFRQAESVVVKDGLRLLSLSFARSAVFAIEWDLEKQTLATMEYRTIYL